MREQWKVRGERQQRLLARVVPVLQEGEEGVGRGEDGAQPQQRRVLGQAGGEALVRIAQQGARGMQQVPQGVGGAVAGGGAAQSSKRMDGMCNKILRARCCYFHGF